MLVESALANITLPQSFAAILEYIQEFCAEKFDISVAWKSLSTAYARNHWIQPGHYPCNVCGKSYRYYSSLYRHTAFECGKEPQFACPKCPYRAKQRGTLRNHILMRHQRKVHLSSTQLDNS
ncbi:longitudinals lacking protein, isoforms A/B/D/L-like [Schistocerca serialis cubense]|uniref:longitudinals lacking protein, isoforms A/B/D/L-like n=1 Tax=Schistocerca serialis cubense TaxID=2023355 RepID=UPI00214F4F65|nr:longitudinals lacking protein, isoforms A/B/D/L-like [Schistocerca serialis cubense]